EKPQTPAMPEPSAVPGAGIVEQAQGAAGQTPHVEPGPPEVPAAGIVAQAQAAASAPPQTEQSAPSAVPVIATGVVSSVVAGANAATTGAVASAAETAETRPGGRAVGAAEVIGKEKVEVAALGTEPGKSYVQAKGL